MKNLAIPVVSKEDKTVIVATLTAHQTETIDEFITKYGKPLANELLAKQEAAMLASRARGIVYHNLTVISQGKEGSSLQEMNKELAAYKFASLRKPTKSPLEIACEAVVKQTGVPLTPVLRDKIAAIMGLVPVKA